MSKFVTLHGFGGSGGETYTLPILNGNYPEDITAEIGSSVTSEIVIDKEGEPASYSFQWYKDDVAIVGATSPTYTFTSSNIGTSTVYCDITNKAGTVTSRYATITTTPHYIVKDGKTSYSHFKSTTNGDSGILTMRTDAGELYLQSTSHGYHDSGLQNIDFSKAKTLHIEGYWDHVNSGYGLEIYIRATSSSTKLASRTISTRGNYSFDIDVSSINGTCHLLGYWSYKGTWRIKNAYIV